MGRSSSRRRRPIVSTVHRSTFGPRGHVPAGVRGVAIGESVGSSAGLHAVHRRSQRPHDRQVGAARRRVLHCRNGKSDPGIANDAQYGRLRSAVLRDRGRAAGDRAHYRSGAGVYAPGMYDGMWR